jgi:hypothetical protein
MVCVLIKILFFYLISFYVFSRQCGTSVPFILCPLIAAIGLLLYHSTVQPYIRNRQGICNFTALIAHPSTGKSPALSLVKSAVIKLEHYLKVTPSNSCLTNSASVEGLLHHLGKIPCMLGRQNLILRKKN